MPLEVKLKSSEEGKHAYDVNCLVSHQESIYSGSDDGKIIKWSVDLKKLGEVQAHSCSIYSLATLNDTIYSCSNDGTVKSWTLNLQEKKVIFQQEGEFWKLATSTDVLFVGDDKGSIRTVVDGKPYAQYEILEGIKDMAVSGNMIYTGKDIDVTITSIGNGPKPTFATRKVMQGRTPLTLVGNKLIFVDSPATGLIINENNAEVNYKQVATVQAAHTMIINALAGKREQTGDIIFFTGSWDKTIKKWGISSSDEKCTIQDTIDVGLVVNCLIVDDKGVLYGGLADGSIIKVE